MKQAAWIILAVVLVSILTIVIGTYSVCLSRHLLPDCLAMPFSTALCFLLSGIQLYLIIFYLNGNFRDIAQIIIPVISMFIFLVMATLLIGSILGLQTGVENMFVRDSAMDVTFSVSSNYPSAGVMLSFLMIAAAGLLVPLGGSSIQRSFLLTGWATVALGALALLGYVVRMPFLYFQLSNISSATPFSAAVLFILIGYALTRTAGIRRDEKDT